MRRSHATPHATAISKRPTDKTNTGQPPQFPTPAAKTPTDRARRHARESSRPRCHAAPRSPKSSELLARPAQNYWPVRPVLAPRPLSPVQTKSIPAHNVRHIAAEPLYVQAVTSSVEGWHAYFALSLFNQT